MDEYDETGSKAPWFVPLGFLVAAGAIAIFMLTRSRRKQPELLRRIDNADLPDWSKQVLHGVAEGMLQGIDQAQNRVEELRG